jgi:hypothetical protein
LHGTDDIHVAAGSEDLKIITGQSWRWRWHGNEIQKEVRTEDDEHESEKDASNDGGAFHSSRLFGLIRNSNLKGCWHPEAAQQFLLLTHIAATESVSVCERMKS